MFDMPDFDRHEMVSHVTDADSGLRAIIAVHSTRRGPAIGGCRVWRYRDERQALRDALRLSRGMTFKAVMAAVPFGGGKAVVMTDSRRGKSPAMMRALGRAIGRLGGTYVTGEDVGTNCDDMAEIRSQTSYVMGLPVAMGGSGDPSPNTALGCFEGLRASAKFALDTDEVRGLHVAVQGAGNVGYHLCKLLAAGGARLTVTDVSTDRAQRCANDFGATVVDPERIYDTDADVFAPCALGGTLNAGTVARLRARIVAGGANNQLDRPELGAALRGRNILYAPDYVINAGGMIQLAAELTGMPAARICARVTAIGETLLRVYRFAAERDMPTSAAADMLAVQAIDARP